MHIYRHTYIYTRVRVYERTYSLTYNTNFYPAETFSAIFCQIDENEGDGKGDIIDFFAATIKHALTHLGFDSEKHTTHTHIHT